MMVAVVIEQETTTTLHWTVQVSLLLTAILKSQKLVVKTLNQRE